MPADKRSLNGRRIVACRDSHAALLVRFDRKRLLDSDGNVLAELADDGHWYTSDGQRAHGLAAPGKQARDADTIKADSAWQRQAVEIITSLAEQQQYLTSDDVWQRIQGKPSDPRLMGNAFASAQHARIIEATKQDQTSRRRENHGRPIRIWRSRRHGQQTL